MWTVRYDDVFGEHHELRHIDTEEMNYLVYMCVVMRMAVSVEFEE